MTLWGIIEKFWRETLSKVSTSKGLSSKIVLSIKKPFFLVEEKAGVRKR
jgi:hypothetical protein